MYARFVLTHLADPEAGLAAMVRALRPGGRLVVEDIDYDGAFSHPASDASRRHNELYTQAALRNGGDPYIGRRLPMMLVEAGVERVTASIAQPAGIEGEVKLLPPLTVENIKAMVVKHGVASDDEVDAVVDELYVIAGDSTTFVATPRIVQVWGEKPRMTDQHYYMIRGGIEGRERLRVLSRVMRPGTLSLFERAGIGAGMRCLDVGCGGGDVTFDLASPSASPGTSSASTSTPSRSSSPRATPSRARWPTSSSGSAT